MIARPPKNKPIFKTKISSPLFSKVANDNRPPQKLFLGWVFLGLSVFLIMGTVLSCISLLISW